MLAVATMRRIVLCCLLVLIAAPAHAAGDKFIPSTSKVERMHGDFYVSGFINLAGGWQKFSDDPVTERAQDGSFPGPLGEFLPNVQRNTIPNPGQDNLLFAVQLLELDIKKTFGDIASLRADLQFGRAASGTPIGAFTLEHAFAEVRLSEKYNVQLRIGRFSQQSGMEPYQPYYNDTISWSIIWRGSIALAASTGLALSADFSDHFSLYFSAVNGLIRDQVTNFAHIPSFIASGIITWGPHAQESNLVLSAFGGYEANNNDDPYVGYDAYIQWWFADHWQLGLESTYQYHWTSATGPSTQYIAGLMNMHWDITKRLYGVLKYAFCWQTNAGNNFLNLTGAEQNLHEISLGGGYYVAESAKIKFELRTDIVDPKVGNTQYAYGTAVGFAYAF